MSRQYQFGYTRRPLNLAIFLLFFRIALNSGALFAQNQSCMTCHGEAAFQERSLLTNLNGTYIGHPWIRPGTLSRAKRSGKGSFYSRVLSLKLKGDKLLHDELVFLIEQGRKEVPAFERIWKMGTGLIDRKAAQQEIHRFLDLLLNPFLQLYFFPGERNSFQAHSNVHISKILLLFGGYESKSQSTFSYSEMNWDSRGYQGVFRSSTDSRGKLNRSTSTIRLSSMGKLESFTVQEGGITAGTLNLAGFLMRSLAGPDFQFRSQKLIYLGKHRGLGIDRVNMNLSFQVGDLNLSEEGEPILELEFRMHQSPGSAESFRCNGSGKIHLRMDGMVQELNSRTRFSLKFLGLPFVKGVSEDRIEALR